ncbi:Na+/glucose cotransporter, partial [bacterium]|nr:Na+/glucose cotransporter [bacterium]
TLFTLDIYKKFRPETPEKRLVLVGQIATVVLVGFGLLWIPLMKLISGQLYQYLQSVQAYISPPIAAVFLIGVFWKRVNSRGAIASLITGFVLGMGRLVAELNKDSLSGIMYAYADINFLHFALFLFVVCSAVLIAVSFTSATPEAAKLSGLTYRSGGIGAKESDPVWRRKDVIFSVVLALCVGLVWVYFRG